MQDLDDLVPRDQIVMVGETAVRVRPLVVRQLSAVAKALLKIPNDVTERLLSGEIDYLGVAAHAGEIAELLALATDTDVEAVLNSHPDHLIRLAAAVFEVNLDFFTRRLAPAMQSLAETTSRMLRESGPTSSRGSSAADTAEATS